MTATSTVSQQVAGRNWDTVVQEGEEEGRRGGGGLSHCGLTSTCCSALSSALSSPHSRLTELNLSRNNMKDSGVDQLCEGLRSENCKLEKLRVLTEGLDDDDDGHVDFCLLIHPSLLEHHDALSRWRWRRPPPQRNRKKKQKRE
ncbi:NLRP1 protein, partial [Polypterus senegalus]